MDTRRPGPTRRRRGSPGGAGVAHGVARRRRRSVRRTRWSPAHAPSRPRAITPTRHHAHAHSHSRTRAITQCARTHAMHETHSSPDATTCTPEALRTRRVHRPPPPGWCPRGRAAATCTFPRVDRRRRDVPPRSRHRRPRDDAVSAHARNPAPPSTHGATHDGQPLRRGLAGAGRSTRTARRRRIGRTQTPRAEPACAVSCGGTI